MRLIGLLATFIAGVSCAAAMWLWLTLWFGAVVGIAGARSIDASPAVLLAVAAVAAIALVGVGLVVMQWLFARTEAAAAAVLVRLVRHRARVARAVWNGLLRLVVGAGVTAAVVVGTAVAFSVCAFAISSTVTLIVATAEHVDELTVGTPAGAAAWAVSFGRMYLATAIVSAAATLAYRGLRRGMRAMGPDKGVAVYER